jgi:predicted short-subunit dehydrogenase-like oxidoreductase (DUF2520 family)
MYQNSISFTGAGRVGEALCKELFHQGFRIDTVVSETEANGKMLARSCKAEWSSSLSFPESTKIIIVAVPDHRLQTVLRNISCSGHTVVAHTAGSFGLEVFPDNLKMKGVFYPLQTFSKNRKINFSDLPILIEASDDESSVILRSLADSISENVRFVGADQRKTLHLAAIFVNNFANHMLTLGKSVLSREDLQFELLNPLIRETIAKAIEVGPEYSQTGPAVRHDNNTIEKHLELLSYSPELQKTYKEITQSIIEYYKYPPNPPKGEH